MTEAKKEEYFYLFLEGFGLLCGEDSYVGRVWAELVIEGRRTWGQVPSAKKLPTAMRLVELGRSDLVPSDYLTENGLA